MKTGHAALLALGIVLAAVIFGLFFYNARVNDNTISVVGYASEEFTSDLVKWQLTLSRKVGVNELGDGYSRIQEDVSFVRDLLLERGATEDDISIQPVNSRQNWDRDGNVSGYTVEQGLFVISSEVETLEQLAINPVSLIDEGITFERSSLQYFSTRLADIKQDLLAKATRDARTRAEKILSGTERSLGKVTSLRAGVFQITEPYSTEVSGYGMYSTQTREKEITVTVHASFTID